MSERLSLAGWHRTVLADGLLLVSADGPESGTIRIRTRATPLMTLPRLIAAIRGDLPPGSTDVTIGPVELQPTLEGEYAALIGMRTKLEGSAVDRTIGVIFGEEWFAAIDGATGRADLAAKLRETVRRLTHNYSLGLGERRRRPYVYAPPPAWRGLRLDHRVLWLSPGFPKRHGLITAFDVRPASLTPEHVQDRMLFEDLAQDFVPDAPRPPVLVATRAGLRGQVTEVHGRLATGTERVVLDAALNDGRYLYVVRLEAEPPQVAAYRAMFMTVVHSVEPLPIRNQNIDAFIHWRD